MSSFKEIKKREKIKAWESKIRRLYANEDLSEDDLKFLNIQYDLYKMRRSNTYIWGIGTAGILYRLPIINEIHWMKRSVLCCGIGYFVYAKLRAKNRFHFETLLNPYFEKYYIK